MLSQLHRVYGEMTLNDRNAKDGNDRFLRYTQPERGEGDFSHDGWPQCLESNLVFSRKKKAGVPTVKKL